ncbi:MAG TPA: hypothetical protein VLM83_08445 [Anaerolineales bacterium]|nr:hypothetical protein [Anaerolineales bacterium]
MSDESERLQILEMIESGVISASEGVRLLNALQGFLPASTSPAAETTAETSQPETEPIYAEPAYEEPAPEPARATPDLDASARKWRRFWWIPMWIGVGITVISGVLMYLAYMRSGFGFWFACIWFPFLLGVAVMAAAWASRTARWLHVRVHQEKDEWPRNIAISLPLPIRLTAWFVRIFRPHIPNMDATSLDELILALEKTSPTAPLSVHVDEGEDGERVEVYIG